MNLQPLTSLRNLPVQVSKSDDRVISLRPNGPFTVPISLTSYAVTSLAGSEMSPLTLSYRWLDKRSHCIVSDGLRGSLPASVLQPGAELMTDLVGITPSEEGDYTLKVSLVLEGIHWACDTESNAWCDIDVEVKTPIAWPIELTNSRGAQAIRGAIAANEIARRINGGIFSVPAPRIGSVTHVRGTVDLAMISADLGGRRRELGTRSTREYPYLKQWAEEARMHDDIDDLLQLACQQEQRIRDLLAIISDKDRQIRNKSER